MKQYLLVCEEQGRIELERVLKGVQFLEVQGMNMNPQGGIALQMLVTPVNPPVTPVVIAEQPCNAETCNSAE